MENYRKGSHTVYDLKYHLVWITKYRKKVLVGVVAERVRQLIRQICQALAEGLLGPPSVGTRLFCGQQWHGHRPAHRRLYPEPGCAQAR